MLLAVPGKSIASKIIGFPGGPTKIDTWKSCGLPLKSMGLDQKALNGKPSVFERSRSTRLWMIVISGVLGHVIEEKRS
jgi:hypothetical protein